MSGANEERLGAPSVMTAGDLMERLRRVDPASRVMVMCAMTRDGSVASLLVDCIAADEIVDGARHPVLGLLPGDALVPMDRIVEFLAPFLATEPQEISKMFPQRDQS